MQNDPSTILRAIAFGTGTASPEALAGIGEPEARAWLKSSPEDALKLLCEPDSVSRLRKQLGLSVEKFNEELRAAIDARVGRARQEQGADDRARCVLRLLLGARLTVASQDLSWLVPGRSQAQLLAAARDLAAGRLEPVHDVKPASIARLLLSPRVLAISDAWTKDVVAGAIRSSLVQLSPAHALTVTAQVRVAAAMALVACGDDEFECEAILEAAGMPESLWKRIQSEVQAESGPASLFAPGGGEPDFDRLQSSEAFARAASWLGFRFDPAHMRVRVQAERDLPQARDPWVRLACVRAIGGDAVATDLLAGLGAARTQRAVVLAGLVKAGALRAPDAVTALEEEFSVHGGEGLAPRAFRSLFEAIHVRGSLGAAPEKLDAWFARAREAYAADPRSVRELKSDDAFLVGLVAGLQAELECLKPFRREVKDELDRRRREKLRSSGRLWLVELVDRCRDLPKSPEQWDGGRDALTPEDVALVGTLIARSTSEGDESKEWYATKRLPLEASLEFRLREAAFACGCHPRDDFVADVEAQRMRVEAAVTGLGLPEDRLARLRTVISRAARAVVEGPDRSAEDPRVLAAFRSADANAIRDHAERAKVRLPHRSVPYSLVGPVSATAIAVCAACAVWMFIDVVAAFAAAPLPVAASRRAASLTPLEVNGGGVGLVFDTPLKRSDLVVKTFLPEIDSTKDGDKGLTDIEFRALFERVKAWLGGYEPGSKLIIGGSALTLPVELGVSRDRSDVVPDSTERTWSADAFKRHDFMFKAPSGGTPPKEVTK
jgi:hypothetical protein